MKKSLKTFFQTVLFWAKTKRSGRETLHLF